MYSIKPRRSLSTVAASMKGKTSTKTPSDQSSLMSFIKVGLLLLSMLIMLVCFFYFLSKNEVMVSDGGIINLENTGAIDKGVQVNISLEKVVAALQSRMAPICTIFKTNCSLTFHKCKITGSDDDKNINLSVKDWKSTTNQSEKLELVNESPSSYKRCSVYGKKLPNGNYQVRVRIFNISTDEQIEKEAVKLNEKALDITQTLIVNHSNMKTRITIHSEGWQLKGQPVKIFNGQDVWELSPSHTFYLTPDTWYLTRFIDLDISVYQKTGHSYSFELRGIDITTEDGIQQWMCLLCIIVAFVLGYWLNAIKGYIPVNNVCRIYIPIFASIVVIWICLTDMVSPVNKQYVFITILVVIAGCNGNTVTSFLVSIFQKKLK